MNDETPDSGHRQAAADLITASGLSKEEVEKMVRKAESHAAEDGRRREEVDVRNQIDSLVYTVERGVREQRAKLQAPEISRIEQALEQARTASDLERMRAVQPQLEEVARLVVEAESRPSGGDQTASGPGPSSYIVDAEVVDEPH